MGVNSLSFQQCSTVLTSLVKQATGRDVVVSTTPDFISVGQLALSLPKDIIYNTLSDVLSRTIFSIRPYDSRFTGLEKDLPTWGGYMRKLAIAEDDWSDSKAYAWPVAYDSTQTGHETGDGYSVDQYVINKRKVQQTNFIGQSVFQDHYTVFDEQMETAFRGPEEFGSFMSLLTTYMSNKIELAKDGLATGLVSNLIGLLLSQNLGSVVAIYISIPLLLVPQILLCGLVVDFSDLDSGSKTGNVPVIGDVIPSRWAFEALAVGTFQYNRYERAWFDLDRERYEALYWKDIVLEDFKGGADPALVERTLPHICEVAGVPFGGSSAEMIEAAGAAFASVCNDATLEKDRLVREAVAERGMEGMVERKRNNYNIRLEELLTGVSEPAPYVVAGGCLVPKTGAVFLTPASKNGRAPFYSSVKILGGARVPTLLYNLCILLLMGMVLTIILLINIKSIKFKVK